MIAIRFVEWSMNLTTKDVNYWRMDLEVWLMLTWCKQQGDNGLNGFSDIYLSSKLTDIITLVLFYNTQISLFSYTKVHCFCLYNVLLW